MSRRAADLAESAPVLDRDYLDRLGAQLGEEPLAELLADGLVELTDRLDRLADHARDHARDEALSLVHDLTSLAGHLGLARLSLTAAACQKALRRHASGDHAALLCPVLAEGEAACRALRARLGPSRAGEDQATGG